MFIDYVYHDDDYDHDHHHHFGSHPCWWCDIILYRDGGPPGQLQVQLGLTKKSHCNPKIMKCNNDSIRCQIKEMQNKLLFFVSAYGRPACSWCFWHQIKFGKDILRFGRKDILKFEKDILRRWCLQIEPGVKHKLLLSLENTRNWYHWINITVSEASAPH